MFAFYCVPNFYTVDSLIDQNNKIIDRLGERHESWLFLNNVVVKQCSPRIHVNVP